MSRSSLPLALAVLITAAPFSAGATDCPTIPPLPQPTAEDVAFRGAWQRVAEPYTARYAMRGDEEPAWGVGYLGVLSTGDNDYDWLRHVALPLWEEPDERSFYGWTHSGRVYPEGDASLYALTGAGLVETGYERNSLIVHEARDDGWLRIRLKPGENGEAWTHQCHLEIGDAKLSYWGWEHFLRQHGDWLHFRSRVPHALREGPEVDSPRITMIGLDHKLELRELRGDWMRVVVEQPDRTCAGGAAGELEAATHEGWVKWRDEKQGPWVWVYTRGC